MARNPWGTTVREPRPMTPAMQAAMAKGKTAPETPDTDTPGLILADAREEPHWIDSVFFRPTMRIRGHKPKNRKANALHGTNRPRTRQDKRTVPTVDHPPTPLAIMRRSGYITRPDREE